MGRAPFWTLLLFQRKRGIFMKKRKVVNESTYIDASFVPATSVLAEREFSQSSLVFSELRQAMTPLHLECVLFLKHNSWLWDSLLVQEVLNSE